MFAEAENAIRIDLKRLGFITDFYNRATPTRQIYSEYDYWNELVWLWPNDGFCDNSMNLFLVRLRSTYRVHFCCHSRRRREEINPIGMYDSLNESSQRTE